MKKFFMIAAMAALTLASCNNEAQKVDSAAAPSANNGEMKIAYVEIDTIMNQYKFCVDMKAELEKSGANIEKSLASKQQSLEQAAAKFQQDIQANKYTQQQAQAVQNNLQKQGADLQESQQRLTASFAEDQAKFEKAFADSLQNFINRYNKDKGYAMILPKQGLNILYADKACDITDEVVKGLNKEYKPAAKK